MSREPSGAVTVLPQRAEVTDCQCLDNRAAREREREPGAACWFLFSRMRREEREGEGAATDEWWRECACAHWVDSFRWSRAVKKTET